ncbi:ubiquitin-conjugating enzyme E2 S-like [Sycon ciliatum]|uniref:ubiquitin-conjugating enzyme E2 S-like n=1 Tax=Sycon ciliatum TaxID=27933 RepID=UPI0020A8FBA6|eukprot:scpid93620/ scgid29584/ Ubiquitin-conjugating enzyme E2 S; Ubiquitin carrier protein S; Ubiquitin-protein ligase S
MSSAAENLPPGVLRKVVKEIGGLLKEPPEDVKVLPLEERVTEIEAVITGPAGTPFAGGEFRMKLVLGKDFPAAPPKGYFTTKIFHPNVSAAGEICVNTLKKDWNAEMGIRHLLLTIKCLLIDPNPASALNEEAGKLILEDYAEYGRRAEMMTRIHAMKSVKDSDDKKDTAAASGGSSATSTSKSSADKKKSDRKKNLKRL